MEDNRGLRILFIEDLPTDVELAEREFRRNGLVFTSLRVDTKDDFLAAMKDFFPDLIISDFAMPEFDGMQALKLSLENDPTIPFIIMTGSMNEDTAVACMKAGATDYVIKEHITRLPFAVKEALEQRQERINKENAERTLREIEERFRAIIENSSDGIWLINADLKIIYSSPATFRILGYLSEELIGIYDWLSRVHPDDQKNTRSIFEKLINKPGKVISVQFRFPNKEGNWCWLDISANNMLEKPGIQAIVINYRDNTVRKISEQQIELQANLLNTVGQAVIATDLKGNVIYCNRFAETLYGWQADELKGRNTLDLISPASQDHAFEIMEQLTKGLSWSGEMYVRDRAGRSFPALVTNTPLIDDKGSQVGIIGISVDITEIKQTEEMLRRRLVELEAIQAVSAAMRTAQTIDEALPTLLEKTLSMLNMNTGMIWLLKPTSDELLAVAACGQYASMVGFTLKPGQGIAGKVFASGQPYYARDLVNDPLAYSLPELNIPSNTGGYFVPIRTDFEIIGVFFILIPTSTELTPDQMKLLSSIVDMAGSAIQRMRLFEETKEYASQFGLLYDAGLAINSVLEPDEQLKFLFTIAMNTLNADQAAFFRYNLIQDDLVFELGLGFDAESLAALQDLHIQADDEDQPVGWVSKNGLPLRIAELSALSLGPKIASQILSELYVPIQNDHILIGVLCVFSPQEKAFSSQAERLLLLFANQAAVAIKNTQLIESLNNAKLKLELAYDKTIEGWSMALDLRDKETEGHTQRVTELTQLLAEEMGINPNELVHLRRGSLLHDIGKLGVPDTILHKPGPLMEDEWNLMKKHPIYAYEMITPIEFLSPAVDIPYCHHEKWDGSGYPRGLKGEDIPIAARIFAIIDVWDALTSDRIYRRAWSKEKALSYIQEQSEKQFDPLIVKKFMEMTEYFL